MHFLFVCDSTSVVFAVCLLGNLSTKLGWCDQKNENWTHTCVGKGYVSWMLLHNDVLFKIKSCKN